MRSKVKVLCGSLCAVVVGIAAAVAVPAFSEATKSGAKAIGPELATIQWNRLDAAVQTAGKTGKPVFVTVYTDWCGYCKLMERTTFTDPGVVNALRANWIPARLNGESRASLKLGKQTLTEGEWAMGNGVEGFPATFLLDSKGNPFSLIPGYIEAPQMAMFLKEAQAYLKAGGPGKAGDFNDWLAKHP